MAKRKPVVIDGEVRDVNEGATLSEIVGPEVKSVVTSDGALVDRSQFARVGIPDGFETNLSAINKG
jgi:hypothetical protein